LATESDFRLPDGKGGAYKEITPHMMKVLDLCTRNNGITIIVRGEVTWNEIIREPRYS
jgi:hypothetical protein